MFAKNFEINGVTVYDNQSDYCVPIAMIQTKRRPINKYGLFTQNVSMGAYICKLLEYSVQCNDTVEQTKCTKTYNFIGRLWKTQDGTYVFPFNKIFS